MFCFLGGGEEVGLVGYKDDEAFKRIQPVFNEKKMNLQGSKRELNGKWP